MSANSQEANERAWDLEAYADVCERAIKEGVASLETRIPSPERLRQAASLLRTIPVLEECGSCGRQVVHKNSPSLGSPAPKGNDAADALLDTIRERAIAMECPAGFLSYLRLLKINRLNGIPERNSE